MGVGKVFVWQVMAAERRMGTEADCWVIMHDLVYNLGKDFLDEHPGGPDVITALAGKDATVEFEDIAHSDSSRTWANKYIIGCLEGASKSVAEHDLPMLAGKETDAGVAGSVWMMTAAVGLIGVSVVGYMFFKEVA